MSTPTPAKRTRTPRAKAAPEAPAQDAPISVVDPRRVREYEDAVLYVMNNTHSRVVWDAPPAGGKIAQNNSQLTLTQKGDPESVAILPFEVAKHPAFQRWWRQGKVVVSDDPRIEDSLEAAAAAAYEREIKDDERANSAIAGWDRNTQRELAWPGIGGSAQDYAKLQQGE